MSSGPIRTSATKVLIRRLRNTGSDLSPFLKDTSHARTTASGIIGRCRSALVIFFSFAGGRLEEIFAWIYAIIPDIVEMNGSGLTIQTFTGIFREIILRMLIILLPFLTIGFIIDFVTNLVQVGWQPTMKPLQPKLSKFNPVSGFKRIFSKQSIVNLLLPIAKIGLVCYIAYTSIKDQANNLFILYDISLRQALSLIFKIIIDTGIKISIVYIVLGFVDYAYQKWKFKDDMKMTKQEVKDEFKNTEGDPQIKGKQKQRMMESSQRRMMQNVPQADVVITNPTHIAVAILYDTKGPEFRTLEFEGEGVSLVEGDIIRMEKARTKE